MVPGCYPQFILGLDVILAENNGART